jgi:light-regulated signal transduction histidine kinase (bacteriophytochrome)
VPIKDRSDSPIGLIGISRDISKAKANEQALVHKTQELIRYNKELERFAFIASHDLQEPLRKVRTFAGLVAARSAGKLDAESQQYLSHLQDAAQRMQTLIRDLLAMSRLTSRARPFSRVDLNAVVQRVLADLDLSIQETGAKLEVAQLPEIDADPTQMQQLFQNLIANALKFRDKERPLVVRITLDSLREPGRHQISVEDNGIGFDPKYAERIFEVFQRLHSHQEYGGTGIGLAICQRIVERHDGSIEAHGRPGAGATFVVSLPSHGVETGEGS